MKTNQNTDYNVRSSSPTPQEMVKRIGIEDVRVLPGDASSRAYFRGKWQGKNVIVMLYPEVSAETCSELKKFCDINRKLEKQKIKVAEIYKTKEQEGWALLEYLGKQSFGDCLRNNRETAENLYKLATQTLLKTKNIKDVQTLPTYYQTRIYDNRRQLLDYYMTFKQERRPDKEHINKFHKIWDDIEKSLPLCPQGFVHGDYHLENLIYTRKKECAVIDHQDAFYGPLPYDLVNLLEDARIDVPKDIRSEMFDIYTSDMPEDKKQSFIMWYKVLAAQFHGRVIGLFIKFAVEQKRDSYLVHIPRLQNYLSEALKDPLLRPLREWFDEVKLDFHSTTPLDGDHVRSVFVKNVD